ncbi:MAG TPA: hypothetical protein PK413_03655, partial [Thermoanaerobaculia bacterium]|nr:hypothetical protein [Thermoanaerobaculia bacterium]
MSTSHPTPELLERLVAGELGETEALRLTWHLHHCDECRTVVELRPSGRDTLAALLGAVELEPLDPAPSYDDVITRTYDALMDRESDLERDRNQAPLLYEELLRHPAARQRVLIDNTRRFHSWGLVELLLANSQREYFNDARIAEELGRLALLIAERLRSLGSGAAVDELRERLDRIYRGDPADHPVDRALSEVVHRRAVPRALLDALLEEFRAEVNDPGADRARPGAVGRRVWCAEPRRRRRGSGGR